MSKLFTNPGVINKSIADYSNANPNAFINKFPFYVALGVAGLATVAGLTLMGAAIIAVL